MSADYFDRLEAELRAAVPRVTIWPDAGHGLADGAPDAYANGSPGRTRRLWRRVPLAPVGLAAAVAVAVVVVVGAVALLGHRPGATTGPTRPSGPPPATAGAYPTLQQLKDNFAILRRPQTAADGAWHFSNAHSALTRLARRLPNGHRVILTVSRRGTEGYELFVWVAPHNGAATGAPFAPDTDYTLVPLGTGVVAPLGFRWTSIVPDSVSRVRWVFSCTARRSGCARIVRTVPARNNVATVAVAGTDSCSDPTCRNVVSATWYAANGGIVASWPQADHHNLTAPPFRIRSTPPIEPTARVLRGDGIARARFGGPRAAVLAALAPMLGPPRETARTHGDCGIDQTLNWAGGRLATVFSVFISHGRFVGYQYSGPKQRRSATRLATVGGLMPGDTVARARRIYGTAFKLSFAQGGSYSVHTADGTLIGYLRVTAPTGAIRNEHNKVGTIAAGDVGCPALSP